MSTSKELEKLMKERDEKELESRGPITLSSEEQETVINFGRTDSYATISTSDSTMKTKFDRMCRESNMWECTKEDGPIKFYKVQDKTLISYRKDKTKREMTDEQREAAAERLRNIRKVKEV